MSMRFKEKAFNCVGRVPEDKCLMVMPEIEEEENLGLSINSLMLGGFLSIFYLFTIPNITIA